MKTKENLIYILQTSKSRITWNINDKIDINTIEEFMSKIPKIVLNKLMKFLNRNNYKNNKYYLNYQILRKPLSIWTECHITLESCMKSERETFSTKFDFSKDDNF